MMRISGYKTLEVRDDKENLRDRNERVMRTIRNEKLQYYQQGQIQEI